MSALSRFMARMTAEHPKASKVAMGAAGLGALGGAHMGASALDDMTTATPDEQETQQIGMLLRAMGAKSGDKFSVKGTRHPAMGGLYGAELGALLGLQAGLPGAAGMGLLGGLVGAGTGALSKSYEIDEYKKRRGAQ